MLEPIGRTSANIISAGKPPGAGQGLLRELSRLRASCGRLVGRGHTLSGGCTEGLRRVIDPGDLIRCDAARLAPGTRGWHGRSPRVLQGIGLQEGVLRYPAQEAAWRPPSGLPRPGRQRPGSSRTVRDARDTRLYSVFLDSCLHILVGETLEAWSP